MGRARTDERREFLGDIITTAVEGGTGYWARVSAYQYDYDGETRVYRGPQVGEGTRAVLHEMNDDETGYRDEGLVLDEDAAAKGIGLIKRGEIQINGTLKRTILLADAENDAGYIDADGADVIAQVALLGEIRYG